MPSRTGVRKSGLRQRLGIAYRTTRRLAAPVLDVPKVAGSIPRYIAFLRQWSQYRKLGGQAPAADLYPCLYDQGGSAGETGHYFYQGIWAFERIWRGRRTRHIDVGSQLDFLGALAVFMDVTYVDVRPLKVDLGRFGSIRGDLKRLPFQSQSVPSLSCLHVIEHVGLGRYGDKLEPKGSLLAAHELARVLAPGGDLFLSLPVGRPGTRFNAHRIHAPHQVLEMFADLELVEFSAVDDAGNYRVKVSPETLEGSVYSAGLFWFRRPSPPDAETKRG